MANEKNNNIIRGFRDENGNTAKYAFSALAEIPEEFEADKIQSTVNDIKTTKENLKANYYNKSEIDDKLDNLEISGEMFQSYYNKTETENKIKEYTAENFYNKGEIDTKLSNFSPENVYTKTEADSTFAQKTELETVTEHVKELPISTFKNDARYVTEENTVTKADIQSDMNYLSTYHSNQAWKDLDQFTINGEIVNPVDGVISLLADGSSYTLSGYLRGCIEIGREFYGLEKEDGNGITLILDNVYIDSPYTSGIVYLAPKKKMTIKIEDSSYNYIYCGTKDISGMEKETTDFRGAIYSFNNMLISGTGYLTIENIKGNNGLGHGIKASELEIIGKPNIYVKSNHDAFHAGKKLIVGNGIFTVEQANDAFGTGSKGYILIFGGKYKLFGITSGQNCFDSNQQGYILIQKANFDITTTVGESNIYNNMSFIDDNDFTNSFEAPKLEYRSKEGTILSTVDSFPDTQYILLTNNKYVTDKNETEVTVYVYGNFSNKEIIIPANTSELKIDKVCIKLINAIVGRIQTTADKTKVKIYDNEKDNVKVNVLYNSEKSPVYLDDNLNINTDCPISIIGNGTEATVNASKLEIKGSGYKHIENISDNISALGTNIQIPENGDTKSAGGIYIKNLRARLSGEGAKGTINIYDIQTNDVIIDTVTAATSANNSGNTHVLNDVDSNATGFKKINQPYSAIKKYNSRYNIFPNYIIREIDISKLAEHNLIKIKALTTEEFLQIKNRESTLKLIYDDHYHSFRGEIIFNLTYRSYICDGDSGTEVYMENTISSTINAQIFLTKNKTVTEILLYGILTIEVPDTDTIYYTPYVNINPTYDKSLDNQEVLKAIDYNGIPALNHSYRVCRMKYDTDSKFFITDSTMVDFIYSENGYGIGESFETRLNLVNQKSYSVFSGLNSIGTGIIYDTETHKVIYVTVEYIRDTNIAYKIKMDLHAYQDGEDITDSFISTKLLDANTGGAIVIYAL